MIILNKPKSLVRYPRSTMIILWIAILALAFFTERNLWTLILTISCLWIIMGIHDRGEQRKGFDICVKQLQDRINNNS